MYNSMPQQAIVITDRNVTIEKVLTLLAGKSYQIRYLPTKVELIYKFEPETHQLLKANGIKYTRLFVA